MLSRLGFWRQSFGETIVLGVGWRLTINGRTEFWEAWRSELRRLGSVLVALVDRSGLRGLQMDRAALRIDPAAADLESGESDCPDRAHRLALRSWPRIVLRVTNPHAGQPGVPVDIARRGRADNRNRIFVCECGRGGGEFCGRSGILVVF